MGGCYGGTRGWDVAGSEDVLGEDEHHGVAELRVEQLGSVVHHRGRCGCGRVADSVFVLVEWKGWYVFKVDNTFEWYPAPPSILSIPAN